MKGRLRKIFVVIFAVAVSAALIWQGFAFYKEQEVLRELRKENAALLEFADISEQDYIPHKFDKLRELVNAHSLHKSGNAKIENAHARLYEYAAGQSTRPPLLQDEARAYILRDLLYIKGFKARLVTLFHGETLAPHTLVEVYNPRRRRWELQDPDYNIFFTLKGSIQRSAAADMVAGPLSDFTPCLMENYCDWQSVSPEGMRAEDLRPYFAAAYIHGREELLVNKNRLDLRETKQMPDGETVTFCSLYADYCAEEIRILPEEGRS